MSKKPLIPSDVEIELANRLGNVETLDGDDLSAKVSAAVSHLDEVSKVARLISDEQPRALEAHAEPFIDLVRSIIGFEEDQTAAVIVSGIFSSAALARLLGDVANGNISIVATTPRKRVAKKTTSAPKKAAPKAAEKPVTEPEPEPVSEPEPEPTPKKAAPKAAEKPVTEPEPTPVAANAIEDDF